jgi:hypothetical protein
MPLTFVKTNTTGGEKYMTDGAAYKVVVTDDSTKNTTTVYVYSSGHIHGGDAATQEAVKEWLKTQTGGKRKSRKVRKTRKARKGKTHHGK